jgi:putative transposase
MARDFLYPVAVMDWRRRYVLAWRVSNTMDTSFCLEALEDPLRRGGQRSSTTDEGVQFTSAAFSGKPPASGSARTAAGAGWTTFSSSGCGAA